jgi:pimeloyl-ACP methyl ester carboxylesterase
MKKRLFCLLVIPITFFFFASCSDHGGMLKSKTFVLVHGAWQGPYVWTYVKDQLEKSGQHVVVVQLPAHGDDSTSPAKVSIDLYRDKVVEAIKGIKGKVVLVGHSMGGVVVSEVAEEIPDQIEKLVYVAAFVPANGQSIMELAFQDKQSSLAASLVPSADQLTLDVKKENIVSIFCQDASEQLKQLVLAKFRVEPAIPFVNQASLTNANFGKVDKYYIHTLQDSAIGIDLQNKMASAANITKTYALNTGHSPFLSKPDELTAILLKIIQ